MTDKSQERIDDVVSRFRESLNPQAQEHISQAHLEDLNFMIREVVSEELKQAVELMEEALTKVRATMQEDKPGMSM